MVELYFISYDAAACFLRHKVTNYSPIINDREGNFCIRPGKIRGHQAVIGINAGSRAYVGAFWDV